jgi:hypothetical protein
MDESVNIGASFDFITETASIAEMELRAGKPRASSVDRVKVRKLKN